MRLPCFTNHVCFCFCLLCLATFLQRWMYSAATSCCSFRAILSARSLACLCGILSSFSAAFRAFGIRTWMLSVSLSSCMAVALLSGLVPCRRIWRARSVWRTVFAFRGFRMSSCGLCSLRGLGCVLCRIYRVCWGMFVGSILGDMVIAC